MSLKFKKIFRIVLIISTLILCLFNIIIIIAFFLIYREEKRQNEEFLAVYPDYYIAKEKTKQLQLSTLLFWNLLVKEKIDTTFIDCFFCIDNQEQCTPINVETMWREKEHPIAEVQKNRPYDGVYIINLLKYNKFLLQKNNQLFDYEDTPEDWDRRKKVQQELNKILYEKFQFKGFE